MMEKELFYWGIINDERNLIKFNTEKWTCFYFLKACFLPAAHHEPASQLIWNETQPTSFHIYGPGVNK